MRKSFLLIVLLISGSVAAHAQETRTQARDSEWKSYVLPHTNYARQVTPGKELLFRVPANWKQESQELVFTGPHSAKIFVSVTKIPDGYPFQQYFGQILKSVRDLPGAADATRVRKTQLQDLEAREICLDLPDEEGEMLRRVLWNTVVGPLAIVFHFQAPTAHVAETEPFFKATVQSVIFLDVDYPEFETLRNTAIKTPAPGPIHELEGVVASLNQANPNRQAAVTRLASLFSSHTDVAIDLLLDRRPLVRVAAVQALAQTNNSALTPFLWQIIDDEELLVAEAAARSVASSPDVVTKTLEHSFNGFQTRSLARVWPFMAKEKRSELLQKIFSQTAVDPDPPKPKKPPKSGSKVTIIGDPPKPGELIADVITTKPIGNISQMGALTLLSSIPLEDFKLPLARLMASKSNGLVAVGLEVANFRAEALPLESVLKLASSSDQRVAQLAAQNLALSAGVTDIVRIEALIPKKPTDATKPFEDELKASIKKIRFRHELSSAKSPDEKQEIIRKALSDSTVADFAWSYGCEATTSGCNPNSSALKTDFTVKAFAENLFPKRVRHYTAVPNPGQAVQKFYETLNGLQLDSPRAQANLVLMMGMMRQNLMRSLSAPIDAETLIEFSGIDPNAPIAMSAWTAEGALNATNLAERKAIVVRVKDRARFERTIEQFQDSFARFTDLTDYVAIGARAMAALPAALPFTVQALQSFEPEKPTLKRVLSYTFSQEKEWNGLRIRTIEQRTVHSDWTITNTSTHVAFIGDAAIITPDLATLRDLLTNANNQADRQLADNEAYRKAVKLTGEIVYFSDLEAVLAEFAAMSKNADDFKISESGSLNLGGASWENNHHLLFKESGSANPFLPFNPKELSAPRELLPASTIGYFLINLDVAALWNSQLKTALVDSGPPLTGIGWAIDFEKEVLPELGPECGGVLLELPGKEFEDGLWAAFCKLKSNKLVDAFGAGKLFAAVGPAKDAADNSQITSAHITIRNGFLVITNDKKGLAAFDGKTNLATTRDYSRAVDKAPGGIVAFGGYNLEAAIAAANKTPLEGTQAEVARVLSSIASAFHSQSFFATATGGAVEARSSVAMDREGRYPIADFSYLPRGANITFVALDPGGVPITDQKRLSSLRLKIKAKAPGPIDNIRDDIKTAEQSVEVKSPTELLVTVPARRSVVEKAIQLPVKDAQFAEHLKSTPQITAGDKSVIDLARQIAGDDRDAWSVARKLADWTYKNLEWKLVASGTVGSTLATREADCTEFSQLFVAMARSLGLPARMVSGLAYSGDSFGGHAWVEVWVGKWVELDPTWGTDFVDATHIRNNSDTLTTSAALNLIELEVLEAKRSVSEFQKSSKALTQHLLQAIPSGNTSDLEAALDLQVLTDELMGNGTWSKMSDAEHEQMWSAYRRLLFEIVAGYRGDGSAYSKLRLLHHDEKENVAHATALLGPSDLLLKLRLVRRNDSWSLVEIVQSDMAFRTVYETFQPFIATIEKTRAGQKAGPASLTDYSRTMLLLEKDAAKAVAFVDTALKSHSADQGLRYLKALALLRLEKKDEAVHLLRELSDDSFPTAIYKLADILSESDEESVNKEAIALYERYLQLEPYDSRAYNDAATLYDYVDDLVAAEAALRKVVELNPSEGYGYRELMIFLALHDKLPEVKAVLVASDKNKDVEEDLFGTVVNDLYIAEEPRAAQEVAASEPVRLKSSALANLILGRIQFDEKKYPAALELLNLAAQLDKTATGPHLLISQVHRKQSRWNAALKAAQYAISLDAEDSEGHYQLACVLARMGKLKEAFASLEKAVELDPDQIIYVPDEEDLKPLAVLPGFKKFLPEPGVKP